VLVSQAQTNFLVLWIDGTIRAWCPTKEQGMKAIDASALLVLGMVLLTSTPAHASDPMFGTWSEWYDAEGFCYYHDEWSDQTPTMQFRWFASEPAVGEIPNRPTPDIDCWLTSAHPEIAARVVWHDGPGPTNAVAYANWSAEQKAQLKVAFTTYWNWYEAGYPSSFQDPFPIGGSGGYPTNLATDDSTIISQQEAWAYFLDSVGLSLAAQLGHWFSWDLRYDWTIYNSDLQFLLDSEQMFAANYWGNDDGIYYRVIQHFENAAWPVHGDVTLTSPLGQLNFLRRNDLVRESAEATLYAALDWGRDHLAHASGAGTREEKLAIWHYAGQPPVQSIIDGTASTQANEADWGVQHYTMGCHGTSGFYKSVLRTVNVPVRVVNNFFHSGMAFPIYPFADAAYLSHSDEIYSQLFRDQRFGISGENPTSEPTSSANILITSDAEYQALFDPDRNSASQILANLSFGLLRYIGYWQPVPTTALMRAYCSDLASGSGHADGAVFGSFTSQGLTPSGLDLQTLEANDLWGWLENRRLTYPGGCAAF
jgi:hypothetical protein